MLCQRCKETPGFHSFHQITEISEIHYFYCFPAHNKQSVRTREDMLNFLSHFPQDKKWSLIFHANGYGLSNMMPLSIALEMGRIIQDSYAGNLQTIFIVEGHWFFQFLLKCILPFLKPLMREKFILVNGSLLEVVAKFREYGLTVQHLEPLRTRFG